MPLPTRDLNFFYLLINNPWATWGPSPDSLPVLMNGSQLDQEQPCKSELVFLFIIFKMGLYFAPILPDCSNKREKWTLML